MKPYYETELGKLYHGDCLEIMPHIEPVDLVLTDPPYLEQWDFSFCLSYFKEKSANIIVTPGKFKSFDWIKRSIPDYEYCWINGSTSMGGTYCMYIGWEPILVWGKPLKPLGTDVLKFGGDSKWKDFKIEHPYPKPISLIGKLIIHWSKENDKVLDSFLGSGTTALSCERLNRRWVGIEIEEKYCEIAAKRIENERKQLKLF
jgi:site-specific DNA-methyltransferase (adenine-specific)